MKTVPNDEPVKQAGERIRAFRTHPDRKWSLDKLADMIAQLGCDRPSAAKLSRIETGIQPTPPDILPVVSKITGLSFDELRPDLAELRKQSDAMA